MVSDSECAAGALSAVHDLRDAITTFELSKFKLQYGDDKDYREIKDLLHAIDQKVLTLVLMAADETYNCLSAEVLELMSNLGRLSELKPPVFWPLDAVVYEIRDLLESSRQIQQRENRPSDRAMDYLWEYLDDGVDDNAGLDSNDRSWVSQLLETQKGLDRFWRRYRNAIAELDEMPEELVEQLVEACGKRDWLDQVRQRLDEITIWNRSTKPVGQRADLAALLDVIQESDVPDLSVAIANLQALKAELCMALPKPMVRWDHDGPIEVISDSGQVVRWIDENLPQLSTAVDRIVASLKFGDATDRATSIGLKAKLGVDHREETSAAASSIARVEPNPTHGRKGTDERTKQIKPTRDELRDEAIQEMKQLVVDSKTSDELRKLLVCLCNDKGSMNEIAKNYFMDGRSEKAAKNKAATALAEIRRRRGHVRANNSANNGK